MRRSMLAAVAVAAILVTMSVAPTVATTPHLGYGSPAHQGHASWHHRHHRVSEWHRLNPDDPANVNNEHERLRCRGGFVRLACFYDKVPESLPGFSWNSTTGFFVGRTVTSTWECPDWFPSEVCDNTVAVFAGKGVFFPDGGDPFKVDQDYVFTSIGGHRALYVYWVDAFACPWYRTFAQALAANPTHSFDCALPS
jgi:hypothetical protein